MALASLLACSLHWSPGGAPRQAKQVVLSNGVVSLGLGPRGASAILLASPKASFRITSDEFSMAFADGTSLASAALPAPRLVASNSTHATLRYAASASALEVDVLYALRAAPAAFLSKSLTLRHVGDAARARNLTSVVLFDCVRLCMVAWTHQPGGGAPDAPPDETCAAPTASAVGPSRYAAFQRWEVAAPGADALGAIFTAQNSRLTELSAGPDGLVTIGYADEPLVEWSTGRDGNPSSWHGNARPATSG